MHRAVAPVRPAGLSLRSLLSSRLPWLAAVGSSLLACAEPEAHSVAAPDAGADAAPAIEPRSSCWPTYPCTQCHAHRPGTADPRERELESFHTSRPALDHGLLSGWCYRCHDRRNVDRLLLPDGQAIEFDASHELCGACHGDKLADWRKGIHGHTTGWWTGPQIRKTCAHCHNPHRPAFGPMVAEPAPARPRTAPPHDPRQAP